MGWIQERETKDGKKRFRVIIRMRGHPVVCDTFPNKTKAKEWMHRTEAEIEDGRYFKTLEAKKHTLKELIERYEKTHLAKKPKAKQESQIRWWKDHLGDRLLYPS